MNARSLLDALFNLQAVLDAVVLSPRSRQSGDRLVSLDVARFDPLWAADDSMYVGPGGTGEIKGRVAALHDFLGKDIPLQASEVVVRDEKTLDKRRWREGVNVVLPCDVGFTNGRHRFAVLRDAGATVIPVAMSASSARAAQKHGLLVLRA